MPRTDRLQLAAVVIFCAAIQIWTATSRSGTATWTGFQPLPTFLAGDGPYYRATLLSIIEDGDIDVRNQFAQLQYDPASHVSLAADGRWVPKAPLPLSVFSIPFFVVLGDRGLLAFNLLQLSILTSIMWLLARVAATPIAASMATLVFMLGTLLRPAAYNWSPDLLSTMLTMTSMLALLRHRMMSSALLLSLALWVKVTNLAFVPLFGAYAVWTSTRQEWLRFAGGTLLGIATIAVWQWRLFGSPLVTPYDRVIASITDGVVAIEPSHRTFFDVNLIQGILTQLTDRRMGLIASAPPIVAGFLGLLPLYRRHSPLAVLVAMIMAAQILAFGSYRLWDQSNFGHRFLLTTIALGAIPFAALIDSLRNSESPDA